ncbi:putative galacturan 1,4-alpha-galacturonidase A [Podospora australis]|uniref:Galacturan 1,4-alpha-galacturonidase A n=1 Tax=Podospora australis TaxID=1536484 RepID=A0AAN7AMX6_9PEZI|nr:putative galacturan 1,4-alpha-galacturonidase A [Podospora australis]
MRLTKVLLVLYALDSTGTQAVLTKTGSTCVLTPLSTDNARAARKRDFEAEVTAPRKRIGTTVLQERDLNPEEVWVDDPYSETKKGLWKPGTLGRYPRPEPSPGSSPPFESPLLERRSESRGAVPVILDSEVDNDDLGDFPSVELEIRQTKVLDDTPQLLEAFKQCGKDGIVILSPGNYSIRQVMNTTSLSNCSIEMHSATLVWSVDNISYWRSRCFSVTYAGRCTAWLLGGRDVSLRGFGTTLFDGNGQTWIDLAKGQANLDGRPISLTVWRGTNIFIDGITWRMAQFWHTFVAYSQNVTMTNLDMSTWTNSQYKSVNTDGTNTWNSKDVRIANWTVKCGDDCISVKGNSTNIHVSNVTCYESGAMVVGSIGSNSRQPDYVENVVFENVNLNHSSNAAWIKTYPGTGYVRNITFRNIRFSDVNQPIYVTSCIYSYQNCDSSRIPITNVRWENITGTSRYNVAVGIHCSGGAPCDGFHFENIDIKPKAGGNAKVLCSNIKNQASSGLQCTGPCPGSHPQQLSGNV